MHAHCQAYQCLRPLAWHTTTTLSAASAAGRSESSQRPLMVMLLISSHRMRPPLRRSFSCAPYAPLYRRQEWCEQT